jgi:predicted MFS family arabinose efflux permease
VAPARTPGALRAIVVLASVVVFADTTFYAAITPLLPDLSREFDLSKGAAGLLAAAYPAGTFAGALPGGWLAARVGVKATVLLGLALMSASSLAFALAGSGLALDLARFVQGLGGAASWAGALAWVVNAAPRERRGELIASAMSAAIAGALCGPVLGAAAESLGREAVFVAVAVIGVVLLLWTRAMPAVPPGADASARQLWAGLRDARIASGMWLVTVVGLLFGTVSVLAPLRLDALGVSASVIALVFVAAAGLEAVVNLAVGRVTDRRGRFGPSLAGLASAAVVMACLPWPAAAWLLGLLVLLASPVIGILWTPSMALVADGAEATGIEQGFAFALNNLAWAVGQTVGAAGSARLAEAAGDEIPYLVLAAVCAATFALLRAWGPRRLAPAV